MELMQSENVVEALLDYFVSPLLPRTRRASTDVSLTDDQQILMAKQMHAVVILYNYYHRKQYSNSKFLDFESFCKVSCMSKPGLIPYLRFIHKCNYESENLCNKYLITEKKIVDACNICMSLDSFKENPTLEAWPVSKVAIFLIDSSKENCVLLYNYSIRGVWSLMENEMACYDDKLLLTESHTSDIELENLAFSTVVEDTGISVENLNIVEHHLAYSLDHEKTVARLYIMRFRGTLKKGISQVSIKDVKTSMEGPVVLDGFTSSFVEYYSVLPYYEIISRWLSRQNNSQPTEENKEVGLSTTKDPKVRIKYVAVKPKNDAQTNKPSKSTSVIETNKNVGSNSVSSRSRLCKNGSVIPDRKPDIEIDTACFEKSTAKGIKLENKVSSSDIQRKMGSPEMVKLEGNSRLLQQKQRKEVPIKEENISNDPEYISSKTNNGLENKVQNITILQEKPSFKEGQNSNSADIQSTIFDKEVDESKQHMDRNDGLRAGLGLRNESLCSGKRNCQPDEKNKISSNNFGNKDHQIFSVQHVPENGSAEKAVSAEEILEPEAEDTALANLQLAPVQPNSVHSVNLHQTLESKENGLLHASLHNLQNKLDKVQQQKHLLEDKIAVCEMNLQKILNEGEINCTAVESITKALSDRCLDLLPNDISSIPEEPKIVKRRKLSEVILSLRSHCQELDNICHRSCWILPRYVVTPSFKDNEITGLFKATVELHGEDFKFISEGDEKSSPGEARESAACQMLTKLRNYK